MANSWLIYVYLYLWESNSIHFLINLFMVEWLRHLKLLRIFTRSTSDVLESGLQKWYAQTISNYKYCAPKHLPMKHMLKCIHTHFHHTSRSTSVITTRNSNYGFNVCDFIKKYMVICKATYNINSSHLWLSSHTGWKYKLHRLTS